MEVLQIIENQKEKETVTLNKKSEITGACRHESRHLLKNWKKEEPKKEKKIPPRKKIPPKKKRPPRDEGEQGFPAFLPYNIKKGFFIAVVFSPLKEKFK